MASLVPFLKKVKKDIVNPVVGGAEHAAAATGHAIVNAANGNFNPATIVRKAVVEPLVNQGAAGVRSVYDIGRGAAASATGNTVALQHAHEAKARDEGAFLQPIARPVIQAVRTIEHPFTPNSYQAKGRDAQIIFGKQPVQNVAAGVQSNFNEHAGMPLIPRALLAGAYGGGQVAQDVATIAGFKPGVGELADATAATGAKIVQKTKEVATGKPFRHVSDDELAAANRVAMRRSGFPDNTKPGDIETYRRVQQKLGADANDHSAVDNAIGARMTYDTRMSQRPKFLSTEGGGLGTEYHGKGKAPHEHFEQEYADALREMESGFTGGQMVPDGEGGYIRTSEHSPFYRKVYAETGRPPTKAAYLKESQRQLQNGRADSYAQEEYNGLKASTQKGGKPVPQVEPGAPVPDALKRSAVEDAPTPIGDALAAKNAKLQAARTAIPASPAEVAAAQAAVPGAPQPRMSSVHVEPTGQEMKSKFPTRLLEEKRTEPIRSELEQEVPYRQLKNKDVLTATQANIDKNEDAALTFAKRGSSTEANATAVQLIHHYLDTGQFEKASDLTKTVNPRFTRQGQETQILAAYSRLDPAGAVRYAQHEIDKAVQETRKGGKHEDETNATAKVIKKSAKDVANQLDAEIKDGKLGTASKATEQGTQKPSAGVSGKGGTNAASEPKNAAMTPEERLAARIKASTDRKTTKPDPITDMVNTLHKVAKEVLPEDAKKAIPRDPMELIGKAIKDDENYHGVYDRAKDIVLEKYKDNPEALDELEKYFSSDIKRTYAQSQLNQGVQSGLKGVDLGKIVKEHYTKVDELGQDLKTKLIERAGLDEAHATQLAGDIQARYKQLVQERKDSIIKQIFGDKPRSSASLI
jgi:hypothetical protein